MNELIKPCYCGKGGEQFESESGYKLCFTCGQHNQPLKKTEYDQLPQIYKTMFEQFEDSVFWPYLFNSDKLSVVLDLNDQNEKIWRLIEISNGQPDLDTSVEVPYTDFFVVLNAIKLAQ